MARWGDFEYKQLKKFQKKIEQLQKKDFEQFCRGCAKELAARLLAKVIKRTPVGQYPKGSGKVGGTLRRGWTAKTEEEAKSGAKMDPVAYARALPISQKGDVIEIEIINPVHYASYVEFGHRTANHKGWVKGRFMLTKSELELEAQAPNIIEKKLIKFLGECFNGE